MRYLCIHGHFYQPPRENPWLEAIELQDSAYPYHDWNERIMAECYAPNTAARILDERDRIVKIVNNYATISFNFGPTLLSWMKDKAPEAYGSVLEADRVAAERFGGHGSALAQCYNHMIMPLANARDKYTQTHWGMADFKHRFGRNPEGMWLPETAVDLATLDILAEFGVKFTVLAPSQAKAVNIDPRRPYMVKLPSGRTINVFFYDGPISRAVAFERLLDNGEKFAGRLLGAFSEEPEAPELVHIATDGETYGHHHVHGEMALAYTLDRIESKGSARLTNYGEYLEQHPSTREAEILEDTAWSCAHGVGRWSADCGCSGGGAPGWTQQWRAPLRAALDWLRDSIGPCFEARGAKLLKDPWAARNDYIRVILDRSPEVRKQFELKHFRRRLNEASQAQVWNLLEMQRHAMLMYTSCGWFFDEISGIETIQVIEYAGRVVQIAEEVFGESFEAPFLEKLAQAKSNIREHGHGAAIYRKFVKPSIVDLHKVGAHYAISSLFEPYGQRTRIHSYTVDRERYHVRESGKMRIAMGQARFTSEVTQSSSQLTFGVLHFGDHNLHAGVRELSDTEPLETLASAAGEAFARADLAEVIRLMDRAFGSQTYSLKDLFKDEQRKILGEILNSTLREAAAAYRQLYDHHAPLLRFLVDCRVPLPREMRSTAQYALNDLLREAFRQDELDLDRIENLMDDVRIAGVEIDATTLEFTLRKTLERMSDRFAASPRDARMLARLRESIVAARGLPLQLVLWSIQNKCYEVLRRAYPEMRAQAETGNAAARNWIDDFESLCGLLSIAAKTS
jgi:alpha-amylase/alpha-mannosidase (GH57 family)